MKINGILERRNGTYGACRYTRESKKKINHWMSENSIPNPIDVEKLHTTVIYSRAEISIVRIFDVLTNNFKEIELGIKGFDKFETSSGSDKYALVALLDAEILERLHLTLRTYGATHDFPEYHPHVTLSYNIPDEFDISSISIPNFKLQIDEIYFEPLNLNWELEN